MATAPRPFESCHVQFMQAFFYLAVTRRNFCYFFLLLNELHNITINIKIGNMYSVQIMVRTSTPVIVDRLIARMAEHAWWNSLVRSIAAVYLSTQEQIVNQVPCICNIFIMFSRLPSTGHCALFCFKLLISSQFCLHICFA